MGKAELAVYDAWGRSVSRDQQHGWRDQCYRYERIAAWLVNEHRRGSNHGDMLLESGQRSWANDCRMGTQPLVRNGRRAWQVYERHS